MKGSCYGIPNQIEQIAHEIHLRGKTVYKCNYYSLLEMDEQYGLTMNVYAIGYKKSWKKPEIKLAFVVQEDRWLINSDLYFTGMGGWNMVWESNKRKKRSVYSWYCYADSVDPMDELYEMDYKKGSHPPGVPVKPLWGYKDLVELIPEAKYLTEYPTDIVKFIAIWKKHPQVEIIYKNKKIRNLWTDTRLWKLSEEKQKKVIPWLLKGYSLNDALGKVKYRNDEEMEREREKKRMIAYISKRINPFVMEDGERKYHKFTSKQKIDIYKYMMANELVPFEYDDYITACLMLKRDVNNHGVLCPRNFKQQHDTCTALANEMRKKEEFKTRSERNKSYIKAAKRLTSKLKECLYRNDKFELVIPRSMQDLVEIGNTLENCVGATNYDQKVVKGNSIIVVIYMNGTPLECCEIGVKQEYSKQKLYLLQLRGKNNLDSEYHKECVEIIDNFIPIAQEKLNGDYKTSLHQIA